MAFSVSDFQRFIYHVDEKTMRESAIDIEKQYIDNVQREMSEKYDSLMLKCVKGGSPLRDMGTLYGQPIDAFKIHDDGKMDVTVAGGVTHELPPINLRNYPNSGVKKELTMREKLQEEISDWLCWI